LINITILQNCKVCVLFFLLKFNRSDVSFFKATKKPKE
jgi:hypothetical protein